MTETSVDPVEEYTVETMTRAAYAYESVYPRKEWPARRHGFAEGARWAAAILASDPRVQALEAVARAATAVREAKAAFRLDGEYYVADIAVMTAADNDLFAALAALQEVTGRGEDGE